MNDYEKLWLQFFTAALTGTVVTVLGPEAMAKSARTIANYAIYEYAFLFPDSPVALHLEAERKETKLRGKKK